MPDRATPDDALPALGNGAALVAWLEAHPAPPRSRRTAAQIDADIEAEREGWDA